MSGQILGPAMVQQQPTLNVAQPLNDVQLVALVASNLNAATATDAVEQAVQIVAEAILQTPQLPQLVRQKQRERAE